MIRKLNFACTLAVILSLMFNSLALAYVGTDQEDYAPGSGVTFSGGNDSNGAPGYIIGESIFISISGPHEPAMAQMCEDVTVGEDGTWECQATLWLDPDWAVGSYEYTATGLISGISESGVFTDARNPILIFGGSGSGSVTVSVNEGSTIKVGITCGGTGAASSSQSITSTCTDIKIDPNVAIVTFLATAGSGSTFAGWSNSTDLSTACITNPCVAVLGPNASLTVTFTASKTNQTISVITPAPANAAFGSSFTVAATASSGRPVAYSSSGVCSNDGATFTMTGSTGTCTVNYSQAGDDSYNAALPVTSSVTAQKATATCSITGYTGDYDGTAHGATGTCTGVGGATLTGLTLGDSFTNVPGGIANWSFSNANYLSQNGTAAIAIGKASSTTVVTCSAGPFTYNGSAQTPCSATVIGAGGLSLTPTPSYSNNTNAGTATASYSFAGDGNHLGSSDSKTFTIGQAPVTATAGSGTATYDGGTHSPSACAVTGSYIGDLTCTNDPVSVGPDADTYVIEPDVSGTGLSNYDITLVNGSFTIDKAPSTTVVTCPASVLYTGSAQTPCTASYYGAGGLSGTLTPSYENNIVGLATASASYSGDSNHTGSSDSKTFSILYKTTGLCYGGPASTILQPINSDGSSVFKQKSTVPAKFRVCDANGNSVGTPGVVVSFKLTHVSMGTLPDGISEIVVSTTPDSVFRWSASDQHWIFNINTKNLQANNTYTYLITLNDGSTIKFFFGLK